MGLGTGTPRARTWLGGNCFGMLALGRLGQDTPAAERRQGCVCADTEAGSSRFYSKQCPCRDCTLVRDRGLTFQGENRAAARLLGARSFGDPSQTPLHAFFHSQRSVEAGARHFEAPHPGPGGAAGRRVLRRALGTLLPPPPPPQHIRSSRSRTEGSPGPQTHPLHSSFSAASLLFSPSLCSLQASSGSAAGTDAAPRRRSLEAKPRCCSNCVRGEGSSSPGPMPSPCLAAAQHFSISAFPPPPRDTSVGHTPPEQRRGGPKPSPLLGLGWTPSQKHPTAPVLQQPGGSVGMGQGGRRSRVAARGQPSASLPSCPGSPLRHTPLLALGSAAGF